MLMPIRNSSLPALSFDVLDYKNQGMQEHSCKTMTRSYSKLNVGDRLKGEEHKSNKSELGEATSRSTIKRSLPGYAKIRPAGIYLWSLSLKQGCLPRILKRIGSFAVPACEMEFTNGVT